MNDQPLEPIQSSTDNLATGSRARHFFVLPLSEMIVIVVIATGMLLISNVGAINELITGSENLRQYDLNQLVSEKFPVIDQLFSSPFAGKLTQLLFWAFIGSLVYMIIWLVRNYSLRTFEDLEASHFVGKKSAAKGLSSSLAHHLFFACTLFFTLIYTAVGLYKIVPQCSQLFARALKNPTDITMYGWMIAGILITSVFLYGFVILGRLLRNSWRAYFSVNE